MIVKIFLKVFIDTMNYLQGNKSMTKVSDHVRWKGDRDRVGLHSVEGFPLVVIVMLLKSNFH